MVRVLRLLRWILFFEGWILLTLPAAVMQWSGQIEALLPKTGGVSVNSYLPWFSIVCWAAAALCLATFWGMGAQKPWVRVTGLTISLFNLAIFPPLGLTGLVVMRRFTRFNHPADADENGLVEESQVIRIGRITATLILLVAGYRWLDSFAGALGVVGFAFSWRTILLILCGQFLVALLHDAGHTLAALAFGFRFRVFRLGAVTWSTSTAGETRSVSIYFSRLFAHDSYLAGYPTNPAHVRWDLIAVAAAGPIFSLLVGLALFLGMLKAPGSPGDAQFMGILSLLFALDFSMQILPFGYSDGRILVDLLAFNRRGRNMVLQMTAASGGTENSGASPLIQLDAATRGLELDPVHSLRENLNLLLRRGVVGGAELAQCYQSLGIAELLTGRFGASREHFERSLELLNALPRPARRAMTWMWLEKLYRHQQRGVESHYAYGRAVQFWEEVKANPARMADLVEARIGLASLHLGQGELGSCVEELEEVEPHLPGDPQHLLLKGHFHRTAAVSGFKLRWADRARKHAIAAVRAYTHKKLDAAARGMGVLHLGDLAQDLWQAGQSGLASDLLEQALATLAPSDASCWLRLIRAEILAKTGRGAEALAELNFISDPDADQEIRIAATLGWAALLSGKAQDAVEYFGAASATLDARERARQQVAQARALTHSGRHVQAARIAREACDILMREEHGEAGMALLLLAADEFRADPQMNSHPFFEEGCRIVQAARFMPAPDKWIGLLDIVAHYDGLGRKLEAAEIREQIQKLEAQMTWDRGAGVAALSEAI
jgi:tetratricopeptide (TPR) repeat protein